MSQWPEGVNDLTTVWQLWYKEHVVCHWIRTAKNKEFQSSNIWISIQVCLMFQVSKIVFPCHSSPTTKNIWFILLLISKLCFIMLFMLTCVSLQYSAVDTNPLSVYVMHPFWNFVVKVRNMPKKSFFPMRFFFLAIILIWTILSLKWHSRDLLTHSNFASLCPQFLPTWLAPNLITFTGFMFLVLNFLMLAFFDFDFTASGRFTLLDYLVNFLHTINWSSPPRGVKLPVLVLHSYR